MVLHKVVQSSDLVVKFLLPSVLRIAWDATPQGLPEHINSPDAAHC